MKKETNDRPHDYEKLTSNFEKHVGIVLKEVSDGAARAEMKVTEQLVNRINTAHGGAIFTLADKAFAAAANFAGRTTVTMQMNINYLRPGILGDMLVAEARQVRAGEKTCFYEVDVKEKKTQKLIAVLTATGFILD
ncbi:MAG: PaaI family thioesterase [Candidatus Omnitrophica bacterium]|nr:PaaI family thioesterase [Candidatus Omnitrophota bacterium]